MNKQGKLLQTIEQLHEKLVNNIDNREEMAADDTRCPDVTYERERVIEELVVALKELKLPDATPCANETMDDMERDNEMIKRIVSDHLEPDKILCHLGWYKRELQQLTELPTVEQAWAEPLVGDEGQRYEVRCIGEKGAQRIVGWNETNAGVCALVLAVQLHPSFHSPVVIDRLEQLPAVRPIIQQTLDDGGDCAWVRGFKAALRSYAVWKDGVQYVGCGVYTLAQALAGVDAEWPKLKGDAS